MLRNLVRGGASVLVAGALLGGGLALGGGSASAAEAPSGAVGSVEDVAFNALIFGGIGAGSIDKKDIWLGCVPESCPAQRPTSKEIFMQWLQKHGSGAGSSS
ncbi:hypothetical protein [Rhodococcus sp. NPDC059234]|uniref:hypothetical protein n=1 Tax=Rhodococcus sp. NPDC059234 TaxID=3346781 RepID=UPI003671C320